VAHLIGAEAVHLEYPTQVVFDSISLGVNDGARTGIVGRNGDGKSSLLISGPATRESATWSVGWCPISLGTQRFPRSAVGNAGECSWPSC
jgi:ABC-type molybdenum transport system ATPase subunit/photorepair protein PhrA